MATAGKINLFGGGEMWSARLHSPPVPSLGQQSMAREASTCAQPLSPFHVRTGALETCSDMQYSTRHGAPYMIYRGREDEASQTFRILGIRHATYIRTCTHRNTFSLLYKYTTVLRKYSLNTLFLYDVFTILYQIIIN